MNLPIITIKQYGIIVYALRAYRLLYVASQSAHYLAKCRELTAHLYDARSNGQFIVLSLSAPSVVSLEADDKTTTLAETLPFKKIA